jgi:hypothetical protein
VKWIVAIAAVLAFSVSAPAHRLDEYLQATRIAVAMHRIDLAIDLTPGVAIAEELLPSIDPDGRARVAPHPGERYAQRVLQDLVLDLDGKRQPIRLVRATFPDRADMEVGEGTIHLQAVAKIATLKPGHHDLLFRNTHLPKISVYLVNALVPENKAIQITRQIRDELQKEYRLSFEVKPASSKMESP